MTNWASNLLIEVTHISNYYLLSWSGGKDSAMSLQASLSLFDKPVALLTVINEDYQRIAMHGVRLDLVQAQAQALALPLSIVGIPKICPDVIYEQRLEEALLSHKDRGCKGVIFGDLYLEDVRAYRQHQMDRIGLPAYFPLWGRKPKELSREFIRQGFQAIITCVDTQALAPSFSGRYYDSTCLADLPAGVDPCGENGEFHSFVFDGPCFRHPVAFRRGETVLRDNRFNYCDLLSGISSKEVVYRENH